MEEILDVYEQEYDPKRPQVCMDEMPKQLLADIIEPTTLKPGQPASQDYEYERKGVADLFMFFEPLAGKRYVVSSEHRTRIDWATAMRELSDVHYKGAEKIVIVMDNLNTHSPASFYEAFEPEEAHRLCDRFEFHYTPKHGSWLNMAEIELSVLSRQCTSRRIPDLNTLDHEVQAWVLKRNNQVVKVNWRFTTADARKKLKHLYPKFQS